MLKEIIWKSNPMDVVHIGGICTGLSMEQSAKTKKVLNFLKAAEAQTLEKQCLQQQPHSFFSFEMSHTPNHTLSRSDPELNWNGHVFT